MSSKDRREYHRAYYDANRAVICARKRAYREANKERIRKNNQAYREVNKERIRSCERAHYAANKVRIRERENRRHRQRKYGLTQTEWDALFKTQGFRCAVCLNDDPSHKFGWHTDHCHATGAVRGILCHGCNTALGGFRDDVDVLRRAVAYVEKHIFT